MLALDTEGKIVPSEDANAAKAAGLDLIGWSPERDGPLQGAGASNIAPSKPRSTAMAIRWRCSMRRAQQVLGLAGDHDALCKLQGIKRGPDRRSDNIVGRGS